MFSKLNRTILLGAATLTAAVASADGGALSTIGIEGGLYVPTTHEIRHDMGNNIFSIGLGFVSTQVPQLYHFIFDIDAISANNNGNKMLLVPVGIAYMIPLGEPIKNTTASLRICAGAAYTDYSIVDTSNRYYSAKRVLPTAALEADLTLTHRSRLFVRYNYFQKVDSFDFSGTQIGLGVRF